jgi:hypothetical protein
MLSLKCFGFLEYVQVCFYAYFLGDNKFYTGCRKTNIQTIARVLSYKWLLFRGSLVGERGGGVRKSKELKTQKHVKLHTCSFNIPCKRRITVLSHER